MNVFKFVLLTLIHFLIFTSLQLLASSENSVAKIKTFEELDFAVNRTLKQIEQNPEDIDNLYCLSRLKLMGGEYKEAEYYLRKALGLKPNHLECLIALTELYGRQYRFEKFESALAKAVELAPEKISIKILQAKYALDKMDIDAARNIYVELLQNFPDSVEALYGMARVYYMLNQFDKSVSFIEKCYRANPQFSPPYYLRAEIHRFKQETNEWKTATRKAVELDPFDADARIALSFVLVEGEGKMMEAFEQAKIALKIDPYSSSAHSYLGNGGSPFKYEEQKIEADKSTIKKIKRLLAQGDKYLLDRKYEKADICFSQVIELHPANIIAMIGKGTINYSQKNYKAALDWFFKVLDVNANYGLAHYGLSRTLTRMKERFIRKYAELENEFSHQDALDVRYISDVFINYDQVDPELQKIIRLSVSPLSNYLKALKIAGATFYLVPFHKFLWQSPHHAWLRGTYTSDLRLWDDVKGVGGFHAAAGADDQRDIKHLEFNVLTHEFAHQVHGILTREQKREIKQLFLRAKKERKTLDYYADWNEWEYFAQGVEAYFSKKNLVGYRPPETINHSRKELLEKDPDLFYLIEKLNRCNDYTGNEIQATIVKGRHLLREKKLEKAIGMYQEALITYGLNPELLNALGDMYRINGNSDQAIKTNTQATMEFPECVIGYLGLADDYLLIERDPSKAIELLKALREKYPESSELYIKLGKLYFYAGDIDNMEKALKLAVTIDPYPDPYASDKPYYQMGRGLLAKEDFERAGKNITYSLEKFDRNNPQAWAELALLSLMTNQEENGKKHLDVAMQLNPELPTVREVKAVFLAYQGKEAEAGQILEKVMEEYPRRIETRIHLAEIVKMNHPGKAEKLLSDALKIVSEKKPVEYVFARNTYEIRGLYGQTTVSRLHTRYAELLQTKGKIEDAIVHHEQALELFIYNFQSALSLVRLYAQRGDKQKAQEMFEQLKNTNPPKIYLEQCERYMRGKAGV